jgi:hypothetical protein
VTIVLWTLLAYGVVSLGVEPNRARAGAAPPVVVTNAGTIAHSFVLFTQKGSVQYLCGDEEHAEEYGETGVLTVT